MNLYLSDSCYFCNVTESWMLGNYCVCVKLKVGMGLLGIGYFEVGDIFTYTTKACVSLSVHKHLQCDFLKNNACLYLL